MITQVRLGNFKAFEKVDFRLAKMTFFLGPNNSGKSSLLAPLRLLVQTIESRDPGIAMLLNGLLGDFGTYKDIVHGNFRGRPISIGMTFEGLGVFRPDMQDHVALDTTFKYNSSRGEIILQECSLTTPAYQFRTAYGRDSKRQVIVHVGRSDTRPEQRGKLSKYLIMENFSPTVTAFF